MQVEEYQRLFELEDNYWWFVSRRRLALRLLKRAGISEGLILDAACGTGAVTEQLADLGKTVGVDISDHAFKFIQERADRGALGQVSLVKGDVQNLPLRGDQFEAAVSLDTLEHVQNDGAGAAELFRTLKPGGRLVVNVPAFRWLFGPHDVALMHHRRYTKAELRRLLEGAGFKVELLSYSVYLLFPVVLAVRLLERRRGGGRISLPNVPGWLNRWLIYIMDYEGWLMTKVSLPFGSSVVAVAVKPESASHGTA
ncbi:MAG: class I SAM-dependent methyltransferase [Fimbriimonadaceae bacterium]